MADIIAIKRENGEIITAKNEVLSTWKEYFNGPRGLEGVIIPLHKKGDKMLSRNYRCIALLSNAYKILSNIMLQRTSPYAEEIVGDYQCGFRGSRSTIDQLFTIRQLLEKCWEFNKDLHNLFVDFQQAYDSIIRVKLWETMIELGVPNKLVRMTRACIEGSRSCIKIEGEYSDSFDISTGLKQGDALSPILFNISLEKAARAEIFGPQGPSLLLAYADDIDVVGGTTVNVKENFVRIAREANKIGLRVKEHKTKYMHVTRNPAHDRIQQNVTMNEFNFEHVKAFNYLGAK